MNMTKSLVQNVWDTARAVFAEHGGETWPAERGRISPEMLRPGDWTGWVPGGSYYIFRREKDGSGDVQVLSCFPGLGAPELRTRLPGKGLTAAQLRQRVVRAMSSYSPKEKKILQETLGLLASQKPPQRSEQNGGQPESELPYYYDEDRKFTARTRTDFERELLLRMSGSRLDREPTSKAAPEELLQAYRYFRAALEEEQWEQCIAIFETYGGSFEEAFGRTSEAVSFLIIGASYAYAMEDEPDIAIEWQEEWLERFAAAASKGPDSVWILRCFHMLSEESFSIRDYERAAYYQVQICDVCREVFGPSDLRTLRERSLFGLYEYCLGRTEEAYQLLTDTVMDYTIKFGEKGAPEMLPALRYLSLAQELRGDIAGELETVWKRYRICLRRFGPDDDQTLGEVSRLAGAILLAAKHDPALRPEDLEYQRTTAALLEKYALLTCFRYHGFDSMEFLVSLYDAELFMEQMEYWEEAYVLSVRCCSLDERLEDPYSGFGRELRRHAAQAACHTGRAGEGIELQKNLVQFCEKTWGPQADPTLNEMEALAQAYRIAGNPGRAAAVLKKTLEGRRNCSGEDSMETLECRLHWIHCLQEKGQTGTALREAACLEKDAAAALGDSSAIVAEAQELQMKLLVSLRRRKQAAELASKLYRQRAAFLGSDNILTQSAEKVLHETAGPDTEKNGGKRKSRKKS